MSPAAVDVRSQVTSKSFSLQTPDRNPFPRPGSSSADHQETINPSIFGYSSYFLASDGVFPGIGPRKGSVSAGRPRPRMVKVRKQLHGRSGGVSNEYRIGLGLNLSQSGNEGSSFGNGCCTSGNGFVAEKFSNAVSSDAGEGVFHSNGEASGSNVESEKLENAGFVFLSKGVKVKKEVKPGLKEENSEFDNAGFVFGASVNNANTKSNLDNIETKSEECGSSSGFHYSEKLNSEAEDRNGKDDFAGFKSGAVKKEAVSSLNFEKEESNSNGQFVFGTNQNSCSTKTGFVFGGSLKNFAFNGTGKVEVEGETFPELKFNINGTNMSEINPEFSLSDEMKTLNVDDFKNVDAGDNKKSSANGDPLFIFRGNKMEEASTNKFSGSSYEFKLNGVDGPVKGTAGENFEFTSKTGRSNVGGASTRTFSSEPSRPDSQENAGVSQTPPIVSPGKENKESSSTDRLGVPSTDFKSPEWDPSSLKASLFPVLNKKVEFSVKSRSKKDKKSKTMRVKLKQPAQDKQHQEQQHVENESTAREALNSLGCYSPMDCSPYQETSAAENFPKETSVCHSETCSVGDSPAMVFGFNMSCLDSNTERLFCSSAGVTSAEDASTLNTEKSHKVQFGFASGLEDIDGKKFSFSASSSTPKSVAEVKCVHRRKFRRKVASEPFVVAANPNVKDEEGQSSASQRKFWNDSEANDLARHGPASSATAIEEACETWRLRGNYAYKNGDLSKAEDFYTRGIKSVLSSETTRSCLKPLVICYSNRAATRMCLGNMRGALKDCEMAAALDPSFFKVQMRAANCHLALGEVEEAQNCFSKCLESRVGVCLDRRITIEAANGLQKSQKVANYINQSSRLLDDRTSDAAVSALDVIAEGLSISPYSERLLEMKAESMFVLRRYEEAIQLCEQTLHDAEKNFTLSGADDQFVETESLSFAKLWRSHLISKSYFYLGRLEAALDLLEMLELSGTINDKHASKILESSKTLAVTIRSLLHYKSAGNEAVRSGRYTDALEHYTAAISSNIESRPFAAICFCNRAAAHQALGQIADAIADCSLAIALDGNYSKAVSRRATLHEMIRDYGHAATDLQRLVSVLEKLKDAKSRKSGTTSRSASSSKELRQAQRRLSLMEEEAKKGIPLDLYLILGVKQIDVAADIKKAYRKAALKHHPDKAGQFLARSDSGDEGRLWKDIVQEVHMDADRLFKMIGEAYAVLSDPTKRSKFDIEEEIRKATKECNGNHPYRRPADGHSYSYRKSGHWQDDWKTYGHSRSRW